LQFALFLGEELLDVLSGLVVHGIELDPETFRGEFVKLFLVCLKNGNVVEPCDWYGKDGVGLIMVHDQEAHTSIQRHEWEVPGEIIVHDPTLFVCKCSETKYVRD
jgi:hypothetical protein